MKQRIRVVGIVKKGEDILLMKRNRGRIEAPAFWELPTGKIRFGEQPEEAMTRTFDEYLGVDVSKITLRDAVTFVALEGASQLDNLYIVYDVEIRKDEKIAPNDRYSAYKYIKFGENGGVKLNEASLAVLEIEEGKGRGEKSSYRGAANGATVYVDGCSRGNPGPAGVGYYILGEDGQVLKRGGEFIGFATSRVAEYYALKEGCQQAISLGLKSVRFVSDNLMMVNQLNGIFKIKNDDILPIYRNIQELLKSFEACAFVHVKRTQNYEADTEANLAVDHHFDL